MYVSGPNELGFWPAIMTAVKTVQGIVDKRKAAIKAQAKAQAQKAAAKKQVQTASLAPSLGGINPMLLAGGAAVAIGLIVLTGRRGGRRR